MDTMRPICQPGINKRTFLLSRHILDKQRHPCIAMVRLTAKKSPEICCQYFDLLALVFIRRGRVKPLFGLPQQVDDN